MKRSRTSRLSNDHRREVLLMYLDFAKKDLEMGRALPQPFAAELERWGEARMDDLDRLNAIQLVPVVESDPKVAPRDKFAEVARRIGRFRGKEPDERLIRAWWESRKEVDPVTGIPTASSLLDDKILHRPPGRPKGKR